MLQRLGDASLRCQRDAEVVVRLAVVGSTATAFPNNDIASPTCPRGAQQRTESVHCSREIRVGGSYVAIRLERGISATGEMMRDCVGEQLSRRHAGIVARGRQCARDEGTRSFSETVRESRSVASAGLRYRRPCRTGQRADTAHWGHTPMR